MDPARRSRRFEWVLDLGLSLAVLAVGVLRDWPRLAPVEGREVAAYLIPLSPAALFAAHLLGALLLLGRRRWTLPVGLALVGLAILSPVLAAMVMPYSLMRYCRSIRVGLLLSIALLLAVITGAGLWDDFADWNDPGGDPYSPIIGMSVLVILGLYLRTRSDLVDQLRERALSADREANLRAERQRMSDRSALAATLHDVAAHWVTLMTMQAGALSVRASDQSTRDEAEEIRIKGERALGELHRLIAVLSSPTADEHDRLPGKGLDLSELVRDYAAGLTVELTERGEVDRAAPEVADMVGRVVAEALLNAVKHAPGGSASVEADWGAEAVTLVVRSTPDASHPLLPATPGVGSGVGLDNLAQRCHHLGGRLRAEPAERGAFVVTATLPTGPE